MDGSVVFAMWRQCALPWWHIGATWWIQSNLCFIWPTGVNNPNSKSIGSAIFAQLAADCRYTLQRAAPFPLKITLSHRGSGPPSNTWFLVHIRARNPNGISVSRFCTDDRGVSLYFTMGHPLPPQNCPFPWGSGLHLIHGSLGPPKSQPKRHLEPFLHGSLVWRLTNVTDRQTMLPAR